MKVCDRDGTICINMVIELDVVLSGKCNER